MEIVIIIGLILLNGILAMSEIALVSARKARLETEAKRLLAVHINDSLNILGSHKDRHAKIGQGNIGLEALSAVTNHPQLKDLPFYLETPNELPGYKAEIALLRSLYKW